MPSICAHGSVSAGDVTRNASGGAAVKFSPLSHNTRDNDCFFNSASCSGVNVALDSYQNLYTRACVRARAYSPIAEARTCELIADNAGKCWAKHSILEHPTNVQIDGVYVCVLLALAARPTRIAGIDRVEFGTRRRAANLVTKLVNGARFAHAA